MPNDSQITVNNSTTSSKATTKEVFCVIKEGYEALTEVEEQLLTNAFTLLSEKRAKVAYVTVQRILQQQTRCAGFKYIIPRFHGELYEHLTKLKARIYGPLVIIQALNNGSPIPRSDSPLMALYLHEFCISFTGLPPEQRRTLTEKIEHLGGKASGELNSKTTHLIANNCDPSSEKYYAAVKNDMEIIFPRWVDFFYQLALEGNENPNDAYIPEDFHIPILHDCCITSSGYPGEIQLTISEVVKSLGGTFSGTMDRDKTTHLIIESTTGEKFKKAHEWGTIKIVTMKWLTSSMKMQRRYPEERYYPAPKTSSQL